MEITPPFLYFPYTFSRNVISAETQAAPAGHEPAKPINPAEVSWRYVIIIA
jgi:hypothetical protein